MSNETTPDAAGGEEAVDLSGAGDQIGLLQALMNSGGDDVATKLLAAARFGHFPMVSALLRAKASVNERNDQGATPLIASSIRGHSKIVKILLEYNAEVNHATDNGDSALSLSVWKNQTETALMLLEAKADVNKVDRYGDTCLHDAAKHGDPTLMAKMIALGAQVDKKNNGGATPLTNALKMKKHDAVKLLLESRAIVTSTAFKSAGSDEPLKKLLEEFKGGVIPSMKDEAFMKHLDAKKPIDGKEFLFNETGDTCLMLAARGGRTDMVEKIVKGYPNEVNRKNQKNSTALIAAAMRGHADICELLIEQKAQINVRTEKGDSALSLSAWKNNSETSLLLLDNKADPTNIDSYGDTVLHDLARNNSVRVILSVYHVLKNPKFAIEKVDKKGEKVKATASPRKKALRECGQCGKEEDLQNCSRCKVIAYCSRECQLAHWKQHKLVCKKSSPGSKSPTSEKSPVQKQTVVKGGASAVITAINARNKKDVSPLLCAIKSKRKAVVHLLLDLGAEVTDTELFMAYREQEIRSIVETAVADRRASLFEGESEAEFVQRVKSGGDLSVPLSGSAKAPPIVWAAKKGSLDALNAILERSPDEVKKTDDNGWDSLLAAAHHGKAGCLIRLVQTPAVKNRKNVLRALGAAIAQLQISAAIILLNDEWMGDACLTPEELNQAPLIQMAIETDNLTILNELLECGADVNKKDSDGNSPLHLALSKESPKTKIIRTLLDYGAVVDHKTLEIVDLD